MIKLKDIAEEAGVTQTTVSYVLSGKAEKNHISRETCDKVRSIAKSLGYKTDDIARAMAKGKASTIGFISECAVWFEFVAAVLEGAMKRADEKDFHIKPMPYYYDTNPEEILATCRAQRLSGLLCYNFPLKTLEFLRKELSKDGTVLVAIGNGETPEGCPQIIANDLQGGYLIARHLMNLGHERIAFVSTKYTGKYTSDRIDGLEKALMEQGIKPQKDWRIFSSDKEDISAFVDAVTSAKNGPTAFICNGDGEAMVIMTCLLGKGFRVPQDYSVVGYGDAYAGRFLFPALTTISEPYFEMGAAGADMVLERSLSGGKRVLDVQLLERESSGPVAKRREK